MDAASDPLEQEKLRLCARLAEIEVAQACRQGRFKSVPHYNEIEDAGRKLGRFLSCLTQSRLANEVAAGEQVARERPTCGRVFQTEVVPRTVTGLDGPVKILRCAAKGLRGRRPSLELVALGGALPRLHAGAQLIHAIHYAYAAAWEPDDAARHFRNNAARMDYPRYRREGLPITSSPMESLIKQINQRVKGTEMFWNDPAGAEAILQIRAASLCDDGRLADYLSRRPGCALTRRPHRTP